MGKLPGNKTNDEIITIFYNQSDLVFSLIYFTLAVKFYTTSIASKTLTVMK